MNGVLILINITSLPIAAITSLLTTATFGNPIAVNS